MYEIRFYISSEAKFQNFINKRKAEKIKEFIFHDKYFLPHNPSKNWKNGLNSMRIRKIKGIYYLMYAQYSRENIAGLLFIKNNLENKATLMEGKNKRFMKDFLKAINFKSSRKISRTFGEVYRVTIDTGCQLEFTYEKIKNLGYTSEIELQARDIHDQKTMAEIKSLINEIGADVFTKPLFGEYLMVNP